MAATIPFGDDIDAARRFAAGFLERCIRDALLDSKRASSVRKWLDGADCVFPFKLVCEFLDLDEDHLRQQIEKQIEKPTPDLLSRLFAVPKGIVRQRATLG